MDAIKAIVQNVIREGKHGPFAVATSDQVIGSVTFSLEPTTWLADDWPEAGTVVLLRKLRQKRAGWRAKEGRFWQPSDEQQARSTTMEFLYPLSRQFPFDEICERIVRELELRNWNVPGITVAHDTYGTGAEKYRYTSSIRGADFMLRFCRCQRRLPGSSWNDIAAVTRLVIPEQELHVYSDESGPTYYRYVGNDWNADRELFINGSKVNSKLNGMQKTYLQYKGECRCGRGGGGLFSSIPHTHPGHRPPLLVHTNDLNREYDPEGREPTQFKTDKVMDAFCRYLTDTVLPAILAYPTPSERVDIFAAPAPIPFPATIGKIFCFATGNDAARILQGKSDPTKLQAAERYGLMGNGYRFVSLDIRNDGTVPDIAYDGFLWCGIGTAMPETAIESLEVPGFYRWRDQFLYVVAIEPTSANGIYIADHGAYERRRKEVGGAMEAGRNRFTDAEIADFSRARGRTIVPIAEYRGGFEQPVVLVNRELAFDEVQIISGPHFY